MSTDAAVSTMRYAYLRFSTMDASCFIVNCVARAYIFLQSFLLSPIVWYYATKRSREPCPPVKNKLLLVSATELARRIRDRKVTSEEVVSAYVERCKEVNPVLNAIVEDRFEAAIEDARKIDRLIATGAKSQEEIALETPLLGVPFTVKECLAVQGMSHNAGVKRVVPRRASKDAAVVSKVRTAGGIPLLVSNTPEYCMSWETHNNVTGTTWNPYDTRRTPGGSSGGEAALLASGSSILGLGTDIGGSTRLPALYCGVFGHKPTQHAVITDGTTPNSSDKHWNDYFTVGLMVRYAEDLPLLLGITRSEGSPNVKPVTLRGMKFFYMEDDDRSIAMSPVDREMKIMIRRLVNYLRTQHRIPVKKVSMPELRSAFEITTTILISLNEVESVFMKGDNRKEWKNVGVEFVKWLFGATSYCAYHLVYGGLKIAVDSLPQSFKEEMLKKRAELKKRFEELLGDNGVLIYPTFSTAAPLPYASFAMPADSSYMTIFTVLGFPVTQCPMGFDREGLPIGLQIVANLGCDHLTMTVAKEIETAFGGWQQPSAMKSA